jgi:hypothetical protein
MKKRNVKEDLGFSSPCITHSINVLSIFKELLVWFEERHNMSPFIPVHFAPRIFAKIPGHYLLCFMKDKLFY